jgi:hypothetical protein
MKDETKVSSFRALKMALTDYKRKPTSLGSLRWS